jgi:hypothetical protein
MSAETVAAQADTARDAVVPQQSAAAARMWLAHHRQGDAA